MACVVCKGELTRDAVQRSAFSMDQMLASGGSINPKNNPSHSELGPLYCPTCGLLYYKDIDTKDD